MRARCVFMYVLIYYYKRRIIQEMYGGNVPGGPAIVVGREALRPSRF